MVCPREEMKSVSRRKAVEELLGLTPQGDLPADFAPPDTAIPIGDVIFTEDGGWDGIARFRKYHFKHRIRTELDKQYVFIFIPSLPVDVTLSVRWTDGIEEGPLDMKLPMWKMRIEIQKLMWSDQSESVVDSHHDGKRPIAIRFEKEKFDPMSDEASCYVLQRTGDQRFFFEEGTVMGKCYMMEL